MKYTKAGDLDSANAVDALIKGNSAPSQGSKKTKKIFNEIVNTTWKYHHSTAIITFDFKRSGSLRAKSVWGSVKWRVVSDNEIIIEHPNGAKMVMTFDKSFKSFHGHDWDGSSVKGSRVSK